MAMKKKRAKVWKYARDCSRSEALINVTAKEGSATAACWAHLARKVILDLREARPESTPLALHFIGVSAQEMLENRHNNAKLCLMTAETLANKALMDHQMRLFKRVFARPQEPSEAQQMPLVAMLHAAAQVLGNQMSSLPDGVSEVELAPGLKAKVIKQSIGKPMPDPRLN